MKKTNIEKYLDALHEQIQEMVEARMRPMNAAMIRVTLIEGTPSKDVRMENHHEGKDEWRDVLLVRGKPVFEVRSRWEGSHFRVTSQWLDGRDVKVTTHGRKR